jgi:NADH:ubiquinone oxidoreductase subunit 5 (subunit L)/multisubunit Na+/H+ antiporter MnhA subunit
LPPLNGFVSEWLLYGAVIGGMAVGPSAPDAPLAVAVVAVALTGALALSTFVKLFGTLFLGQERTGVAAGAHDPSAAMLAPMGVLVSLCLAIGVLPRLALVPIERAVSLWGGEVDAAALAIAAGRLATASAVAVATAGVAVALVLWLRTGARRAAVRLGTWDCGYAMPTARMQYTESSFAELTARLFAGLLVPQLRRPELGARFPASASYESETPDVVLDRGVLPMLERATRGVMRLRLVQQGRVQVYVLYILLGLLVLLVVGR